MNTPREMHLSGLRYRDGRHTTINSGRPVAPDFLVLHYSAGGRGVENLRTFMQGRKKAASYNQVYGQAGEWAEFVPQEDASWHAGDGWLPLAEDVIANGFVPVKSVVKPPKRYTNLRTRSAVFCNRGYVSEERALRIKASGGRVIEARHRNPASRNTLWEAYAEEQIEAFEASIPYILEKSPTIKAVCAHEDVTNGFIFGGGKWKGGSKVDIGPAGEELYQAIDWQKYGLTVVRYDFEAQGWRAYPNMGNRSRSYNGPGSVPCRVEPGS